MEKAKKESKQKDEGKDLPIADHEFPSKEYETYLRWSLRFQQLQRELEKRFPGQLEFEGEATPTATGWLEVKVNGKLVHSKKNGDGYVDKESKLLKIVAAVEAALKK
ncbi:hypothetical protein AB205_0032390 [Aquarana catesbeiana]|uniref:Selenoprotein W n=1 Tax=Aquarana catesbeiana TaxID=8400 RepID=A0A2G9RI05_AQUCT|nr:hypothetical protein AB205_0032390 [Aquarana catesbeiana]PIO27537.1 hypothetical protein AB205_0032390 [Aquarana catesbeiana]